MDVYEATKIVYSRIQEVEHENVSKIVGYLLLQDHGDREMIRLAFSPDSLIHSLINNAKSQLGLPVKSVAASRSLSGSYSSSLGSDLTLQFAPYSPTALRPFSSSLSFPPSSPYWGSQHVGDRHLNFNYGRSAYGEVVGDEFPLHNHGSFLGLDDRMEPTNVSGTDEPLFLDSPVGNPATRASRRTPNLPEFPLKPCLYYARGFCKHGHNCRFFHSHSMSDSFVEVLNGSQTELSDEDPFFSPGTLERLEFDLAQLLRAKRTPISIAALPQLYYERYGRTLQAEGYLTESQRHGKSGHSLTKLLVRMNSIVVIERPHGQHVVVLTEDVPRYSDRQQRSDLGSIVSRSRQIYLTFPSESTFTEDDVSNYFRNYGPVQDVRIPCQQKRMFGFVTFVYPETVRLILTKVNPHFICSARVLVKPYREKARIDRKYQERFESPMYYSSQLLELDPAYHSVAGICDNSQLLRNHLIEEHERALEIEGGRLAELQISPKPLVPQYFNDVSVEELKHLEDHRFSYLFDVLNSSSMSDEKNHHISNDYKDQDSSQGLNLPESPFASPITSGIPTAI